jgi:hypothetical protein
MSVVTVTINLLNYPTVFMSQDIAAVVDRVKTAAVFTDDKTAPKPCIQFPLLDAMINEQAFLELPALPEFSYNVTS